MEQQVILRVRAGSDDELTRKLGELRRIAADETEDPTAGGASQPPTPTPAPRPGGLIDVGEASGKRGEEVAVEIRGHCGVAVMGFAMAIGYESRDLAFKGVDWPALWGIAEGAEVLAAGARDRHDPGAGNAGPCVVLNIARFDIRSTAPGSVGPAAGVTLDPVILPQGTLLATLRFTILPAAKPGKVVPLFNETRKYGKPKIVAEFTTLDLSKPNHREMGPAIEPELEHGQVVVTG